MSDAGLPPPGYYPDPDNPAVQRWWDGSAWAVPPSSGARLPDGSRPEGTAADRPPTNVFALASLAFGLAWIAFVGSILAVVFGHVAVAQIQRSGGREAGRGLAIAGLIVGYIGVGILGVLVLALAT